MRLKILEILNIITTSRKNTGASGVGGALKQEKTITL